MCLSGHCRHCNHCRPPLTSSMWALGLSWKKNSGGVSLPAKGKETTRGKTRFCWVTSGRPNQWKCGSCFACKGNNYSIHPANIQHYAMSGKIRKHIYKGKKNCHAKAGCKIVPPWYLFPPRSQPGFDQAAKWGVTPFPMFILMLCFFKKDVQDVLFEDQCPSDAFEIWTPWMSSGRCCKCSTLTGVWLKM